VLVAKLLTEPPPPLAQLRPGLPVSLVRAIHRALEKEPRDRFESAEQFAAARPSASSPSSLELAGTLDGSHAAAMSAPRRPGRFRNVKIAAIAFTLAAAATAVVLVVNDDGQAPAPAAPAALPAAGSTSEPAVERKDQTAPRPPITTGTLFVQSTPDGASVTVDETPRGATPITVTLEPGRHRVRIELEGHTAVTTEAEVRANERASVLVPLSAVAPPPKGAAAPQGAQKTVKPGKPAGRGDPRSKPAPAPPSTTEEPRQKPSPVQGPAPADEPKPKPAPTDEPKRTGVGTKPNPY
jgi:eukaryotic-like serine/threonine-protein kinase